MAAAGRADMILMGQHVVLDEELDVLGEGTITQALAAGFAGQEQILRQTDRFFVTTHAFGLNQI